MGLSTMTEVQLRLIDAQAETLRKEWRPEEGSRFVAQAVLELARQVALLNEGMGRAVRTEGLTLSDRLRELREQLAEVAR